MTYTAYTDEQVFQDPRVNTYCNIIVNYILQRGGDSEPFIYLTGSPAKMIQGVDSIAPVEVVPFITPYKKIIDALSLELNNLLPVVSIQNFQNRIQIATDIAYFEFWLSESAITLEAQDGINMQLHSEIPSEIS